MNHTYFILKLEIILSKNWKFKENETKIDRCVVECFVEKCLYLKIFGNFASRFVEFVSVRVFFA